MTWPGADFPKFQNLRTSTEQMQNDFSGIITLKNCFIFKQNYTAMRTKIRI